MDMRIANAIPGGRKRMRTVIATMSADRIHKILDNSVLDFHKNGPANYPLSGGGSLGA